MKKYIFPLIVFSLLAVSSCDSFLDMEPDDRLTEEMVFSDATRCRSWQAAVYSTVPNMFYGYVRDLGVTHLTDDCQINPMQGASNAAWRRIVSLNNGSIASNFSLAANSNVWNKAYKSIRSAYIFIEKAKALPDQNLTEEEVTRMKMECRFLIAYYYELLLELYGPVPLVKGLFASNADTKDLMLPRTPADELAQWIDDELTELAAWFPEEVENKATMMGRPTKGMCLAVRARLWMWMASPLMNGNTDYASIKNPDGSNIFPQTEDPSKWNKALAAVKDLIDLAESGRYSLYKEYKDEAGTIIDPFKSLQQVFVNYSSNPEIVWFADDRTSATAEGYKWYNRLCTPRGSAGGSGGYYGATVNLADAFFMDNGLSPIDGYYPNGEPIINPASGYVDTGYSTSDYVRSDTSYDMADAARTPGLIAPKGTYNMNVHREPRFYTTLWYNHEWIPNAERYTAYYSNGVDGGPTHDAPYCGVQVRKMLNPATNPQNAVYGLQPAVLMRLAEFYLDYAEAMNEVDYNTNRAAILDYINRIRERAGIPLYSDDASLIAAGKAVKAPDSQDEMRTAIRKEWRVEFAAEGSVRYNNIRRWKIAEDLFETPIYGMNFGGTNDASFFKRTLIQTRVFQKKHYFWFIPLTYINNNPNLVQNLGW